MKLKSLTIRKFRSITNAYKLPLLDSTVLIGPNNEGKSNVLRALVLATSIVIGRRQGLSRHSPRVSRENAYNWERDFPTHLQERGGESSFVLEYELTPDEVAEFKEITGSSLNGTLPLQIAIGKEDRPKVTVHKPGRGNRALTQKGANVAAFIADRIELEYIPAVRTAESAQEVITGMVAREIASLENDENYVAALERIAELQKPVLDALSKSIHETLLEFLPEVKRVEIRSFSRRIEALRRCDILIDDGSLTELRHKGDGVQSLAALGVMRHASSHTSKGKHVILAIEEPESHLHPRAIQQLRVVIEQLAQRHQIVVSTHCPLFVARDRIESNIIVHNRKAEPAKSVNAIREILGVQASDNLVGAEVVLVVEGEDDRISLRALLAHHSPVLKEALQSNRFSIDTLGGASNLAYKLTLLRNLICRTHALLDHDDSGKEAYQKSLAQGLISDAQVTFTRQRGRTQAEFEDLLAPAFIKDFLKTRYGIAVLTGDKRNKWSDRMADTFASAGKPWDKAALKLAVAKQVEASPGEALPDDRRSVFDALVASLENLLGAEQPLS